LIYCPSSTRHSITNVGKGKAKVISIDASAEGVRGGPLVYSKNTQRQLKWQQLESYRQIVPAVINSLGLFVNI